MEKQINESESELNQVESDFQNIKLDNIKNLVNSKISELGFYDKIKHLVTDNIDEEKAIDMIKDEGFIEEILKHFREDDQSLQGKQDAINKSLYVKIMSGKGFIDYIKSSDQETYFQFDVLFFGQRVKSKKIPACSEFSIDQSFLLDFNPLKLEIEINYNILKKICSPVHFILVLHKEGEKILVGSKSIEWRWVLCYGSWKIEAEIYSPNTLNKLNVGTIDLQLSLLPFVAKNNLIPERLIFEQLNDEKKNETDKAQDFISYANDWWEDYKTIRPSHGSRLIKLFVPTEDREN